MNSDEFRFRKTAKPVICSSSNYAWLVWDRVYVFAPRLTLDWANYPDQGAAPADADKKREGA